MKSQFRIGDKVTAIGFVDCFGKQVTEKTGLTVKIIRLIESEYTKPYFRIMAESEYTVREYTQIEGAERFFRAA